MVLFALVRRPTARRAAVVVPKQPAHDARLVKSVTARQPAQQRPPHVRLEADGALGRLEGVPRGALVLVGRLGLRVLPRGAHHFLDQGSGHGVPLYVGSRSVPPARQRAQVVGAHERSQPKARHGKPLHQQLIGVGRPLVVRLSS
jgi:hypothetical protein